MKAEPWGPQAGPDWGIPSQALQPCAAGSSATCRTRGPSVIFSLHGEIFPSPRSPGLGSAPQGLKSQPTVFLLPQSTQGQNWGQWGAAEQGAEGDGDTVTPLPWCKGDTRVQRM